MTGQMDIERVRAGLGESITIDGVAYDLLVRTLCAFNDGDPLWCSGAEVRVVHRLSGYTPAIVRHNHLAFPVPPEWSDPEFWRAELQAAVRAHARHITRWLDDVRSPNPRE